MVNIDFLSLFTKENRFKMKNCLLGIFQTQNKTIVFTQIDVQFERSNYGKQKFLPKKAIFPCFMCQAPKYHLNCL